MFATATTATRNFLGDLVHDIRSDNPNRWRMIAVLAGISTFSMFDGLIRFMGGYVAAGPVGILMSGMLSITLQGVLVTAVNAWLHQRDRSALYVYLICVFVSVPVAMGFWYEHLGLNQRHAGELYRQAIEHNLDRLRTLDSAYESFADTSLRLANHSEERAKAEAAHGGTCDVPMAGAGARTKIRANDAQVLGDYGRHFSERREVLKGIVRDAEALHGVRVDGERIIRLRDGVSRANALAQDPRIAQLKGWLADRVAAGRDGVIRGGVLIRCRDSVIEENARSLTRITLVTLPMPEIPNPSVAGAGVIESFGIAFSAITLQWQKISSAQWVELVMGVLVDAAIFFMMRSMHLGANPIKDMDIDGLAADSPSRQALGHVLGHSVRKGNHYLVSVPPDDERLRRIVCALEFSGLASYVRPHWYASAWLRTRLGVAGNKVEIYAVPVRGLLTWVVDPYRRGSGTQVDGRVLPAGVTPIGLHGAADRKNG